MALCSKESLGFDVCQSNNKIIIDEINQVNENSVRGHSLHLELRNDGQKSLKYLTDILSGR